MKNIERDEDIGPIVSVIMPTYGRTDYLREAIQSVLKQTFTDFEFIIVDDNDPSSVYRKETADLINELNLGGASIIYIPHNENKNGAAARNTGFFHSRGKYISFLDSDDFYDCRRLELCVAYLEGSDDTFGGVYTGIEFRKNGVEYHRHVSTVTGRFLVQTLGCTFLIGTGSNLFVRRTVLEELQGFDESFLRHQDFEFLVRFFERYQIGALQEVLVTKNNENLNLPTFSRSLQIKEQYLDKFRYIIDGLSESDKKYVYFQNYIWLGEMALRSKNYKASREMYSIARRYGTLSLREHFRRVIFWLSNLRKLSDRI